MSVLPHLLIYGKVMCRWSDLARSGHAIRVE